MAYLVQVWLSCCCPEQVCPPQAPLATLHWRCWLRSSNLVLSHAWPNDALAYSVHRPMHSAAHAPCSCANLLTVHSAQ